MTGLLLLLAANMLVALTGTMLAVMLVRAKGADERGLNLFGPACALMALALMDGAAEGLGVYRLIVPAGASLAMPLYFGIAPLVAAGCRVAGGGKPRPAGDVLREAGPIMLAACLLLLPFWLLPVPQKIWLLRGWGAFAFHPDWSNAAMAGLALARALLIGQGLFYMFRILRHLRAGQNRLMRPVVILTGAWTVYGLSLFYAGDMLPRAGELLLGLSVFWLSCLSLNTKA